MRSLRRQLFAAILGAVLLAVGVSLAAGILLSRGAIRDTIKHELSQQADGMASQLAQARRSGSPGLTLPLPGPPRPAGPIGGALRRVPRGAPGALGGPPGGPLVPVSPGGAPAPSVTVISTQAARGVLPASASSAFSAGRPADGTFVANGRSTFYAARRVGPDVVLVTRADEVSGGDLRSYVTALLIASGLAILLAAGLAALLARRVAAPLRRVVDATRVLATGRSPEPVPKEKIGELAALADAFNELSSKLSQAREAERAVLLSVSHELRTPLTSIKGYAEGIQDGTIDPRQASEVVAREAGRLERLVGDLLALARLEQGVMEVRREPVDLAEVASEAEERLRPQARAANVNVRLSVSDPAEAMADHGRTLQVVSNLLDNAIRVTPEGGEVELRVAARTLEVADQGPGIPSEDLPNAFERFHLRTRHGGGSPDGAGLGLAIVRELSEAMGGTVRVANRASGGSSFTVSLPA